MFIFVLKKRAGVLADITMSLEEYGLRAEAMRLSFDTALELTEEKVKAKTPPTKARPSIRKRKLRLD